MGDLKLHEIPKDKQKHSYFQPLNELWKQYITSNFRSGDNRFSLRANERLLKVDYHGAEFIVVNSKCQTLIGLKGIVVKETKNVFTLITAMDTLKYIPKKNSVFMYEIDGYRVRVNGDAIIGRPGFRSSKKIKGTY